MRVSRQEEVGNLGERRRTEPSVSGTRVATSTAPGAGGCGRSAVCAGGCVYVLLIKVDDGRAVCQCISGRGGGPARTVTSVDVSRRVRGARRYEYSFLASVCINRCRGGGGCRMWQLEKQQYNQCRRERHERHEHVLGRNRHAGYLGDIVHERFLRDERAEVADPSGQG